ncbi:MAG: ADOP family duplicated permease [Gemmatimonadaceae bacterium]|nr:ADOP family duplicated permease [Gemmatimonadaceae bacterium]
MSDTPSHHDGGEAGGDAGGTRRRKRLFSLPASRARIDDEVRDELQFHIEERVEQFVAEGMTRADAEREVTRRFGDYEQHRIQTKRIDEDTLQIRRRSERLHHLRREVGLALRSLRRSPGFTIVAFTTLMIGIAATTGIFSILDAVVLRPLPYPNSGELVSVLHPATVPGSGERVWGISPAGYFEFAKGNRSFSSFGVFRSSGLTVTNNDQAERTRLSLVTASVFTVLAARPHIGRLLTADDDRPESPPVAVLSHEFFERRFGGDASILGRNLETNLGPIEIVGVAEPGLALPMPGPSPTAASLNGFGVDVWLAMRLNPSGPFYNEHPNVGIGRLKPGTSVAEAQTDLGLIFSRFAETLPTVYSRKFVTNYNFRLKVEAMQQTVLGPRLPRTLWMLFGAVLLVLGIATMNVANLYLVRLDVRRRESAVRTALGADRVHIAAHHLAETLLLCLGAAAAGITLAAVALHVLLAIAPTDIPRLASVTLNARAIVLALLISTLLALILGLLPLLRRGIDMEALRAGTRGPSASPRQRAVRNTLVVGQLAMALTLLAAAGLMLRSFDQLRRVRPGFNTSGVLAFDINLPFNEFGTRSLALAFHQELQRQLRELRGVQDVGSVGSLPLEALGTGCFLVFREGRPYGPDEQTPCVPSTSATPGLFAALRVPVRGRVPTWGDVDGRTHAVVITKALADRLWPNEEAIGRGLSPNGSTSTHWYRVVGVTDEFKGEALDAPETEAVFYAASGLRDPEDGNFPLNEHSYLVRTDSLAPLSLLPAVREIVARLNPRVPVVAPRTMDTVMQRSMARTTFLMVLLAVAASVALLLSAVGIYGVISYLVTQRRAEIGIRMALGASVSQIMRLVLMQSVRLAVIGVAVGLMGAFAVSRLIQATLFGVSPNDPLVLILVVVVLFAATVVASIAPARRAAQVEPSEAMRAD